jgi:V/A-type H+-transporting ATPase subunit I
MIVPMKRVTLLCLAADGDASLAALRDLGVMHLEHVSPPAGAGVEAARARLERAASALALIEAFGGPEDAAEPGPSEGDAVADAVHEAADRRRALADRLETLEHEADALAPYGRFDPEQIRRLAAAGVRVRLFRLPRKAAPAAPEGATLFPLRADRSGQYVALVETGPEAAPFPAAEAELPLPSRSLDAVEAEQRSVRAESEGIERDLARYAPARPVLAARRAQCAEELEYAEARAGMGAADAVAFLRGYCPVDRVEDLRRAAGRHGWGLVIHEPDPDTVVPTLIRSSAWVRPIRSVFDMLGILPGYREIDISAAFLFFLSIFFAILVGDAAYGAIFLALTIGLRLGLPKAPREPFRLLGLFSVCTIAWGVLTANYFGIRPAALPAPLAGLRVGALADETTLKTIMFLIGAIHLTLAHAWNGLRQIRSTRALAQVGWILLTWNMYFWARHMVLGQPLPDVWVWLLCGGAALVVLFMTPPGALKKEWTGHVMFPLDVISNFVDVVSYIRLFAVGAASLAVAEAFNGMAAEIGFNSIGAGLLAAFVVFFGHTLNIALCAMSVLVHGVRLNALEFSGHIGLQWTGTRYTPFARRTETT